MQISVRYNTYIELLETKIGYLTWLIILVIAEVLILELFDIKLKIE